MKCILLTVCLAAAASAAILGRENQPSEAARFFEGRRCSRSLPSEELNACIKNNIQSIIPQFTDGEKLFDLEPLDPLPVGEVRAALNRDPLNFISVARNSKVHGISAINVRDVRATLNDERVNLELNVLFPKFLVEGDFKTEGKFGSFPFSGKGPFNMSFTDLDCNWKIQGVVVEKDGEKFIQIKRFIPNYTVGSMKVWADNIITGAPELTNLVLTLANQFWEAGLQIMSPVVNPEFERFLRGTANKVFSKVPYEALFPVSS